MELKDLIAGDVHFCWMEGDAFETLSNCFDVEAERLKTGETCKSEGRFAICKCSRCSSGRSRIQPVLCTVYATVWRKPN